MKSLNITVSEIGNSTLENIGKGVSLLKGSIIKGYREKPEIVIYSRKGNMRVGIKGKSPNSDKGNVYEFDKGLVLIYFTEESYQKVALKTENVKKIARIIQTNAHNREKLAYEIPYQEYDDLLYNVSELLEDDNSLNIVYDKGVQSFNAYDYIHKEDMVEEIRGELNRGKELRGIQVRGISRVTVYIQVKDYNDTSLSFTYLGNKDNVYHTFDWDGKDNLRSIIGREIRKAKDHDNSLTTSVLNKDDGGYTPKKSVGQKSVMNMSDDEYGEILEDY